MHFIWISSSEYCERVGEFNDQKVSVNLEFHWSVRAKRKIILNRQTNA